MRRARTALLGLLLLGMAPAAALAAPSDEASADAARVAAAFGNTVTSTYPDGRSQKIWLHPDGAWTGLSRAGTSLAGAWRVKDDKVCLRQKSPPTLPVSLCIPLPQDARVGVTWMSKDFSGTPIRLRLAPGSGLGN